MKRTSIILCSLMAIAFAACTKENPIQENQSTESVGELVTVIAYTAGDGPETRVDADWVDKDEKKVMQLSWSDDDQFSVIRGGVNQTFSRTTEEGANAFTGTLPDVGEGNYYAAYPVVAEATNPEAVPFDISVQNDDMSYLMYTSSTTGFTYGFHHAVAYLKATFPDTFKGETATITVILPEEVYADGTINLTDGTLTGGSKQSISKTVTFDAESTEVLLAIPPMAAENKTMKFIVEKSTIKYISAEPLAGNPAKAIEAGKYYSANITLEQAEPCILPGYDNPSSNNGFNNVIKAFLSSNTNLTKIKFIASSYTTSEDLISKGAYMVAGSDGITLEIHTKVPEFNFNSSDCSLMFSGLSSITSIDFNNCVNMQGVTEVQNMFLNCPALTSIRFGNNFNTTTVTNMIAMFKGCTSLTSVDLSNLNTAAVTDMSYMFYNCSALTSLDLSKFNTAAVTDMNHMFYGCSALTSLDLSNFDTAAVTDMSFMFSGCSAFTSLNLSNLNTAAVTDMNNMFFGCSALTSLDLSDFNTEKVIKMDHMFYRCSALTSLDLSDFNTEKVIKMDHMFYGCSTLTSLDLSNFNTANVTNMNNMFYNCSYLASIIFGDNFNTEKVTDMSYMFSSCSRLIELNLTKFTFANVNITYMFMQTGSKNSNKTKIYVKDADDQATLTNGNTGIGENYAEIVVQANN